MKALALVGLCSCSFLLVSGPDTPDPTGTYKPLDCDEGALSPVIDVLAAIATAVGTAATLATPDIDHKPSAIVAGVSLVFAASAYYGFHETGKCKRLRAAAIAPGHEGQACTVSGCDAGLACASQLCVRPPS